MSVAGKAEYFKCIQTFSVLSLFKNRFWIDSLENLFFFLFFFFIKPLYTPKICRVFAVVYQWANLGDHLLVLCVQFLLLNLNIFFQYVRARAGGGREGKLALLKNANTRCKTLTCGKGIKYKSTIIMFQLSCVSCVLRWKDSWKTKNILIVNSRMSFCFRDDNLFKDLLWQFIPFSLLLLHFVTYPYNWSYQESGGSSHRVCL